MLKKILEVFNKALKKIIEFFKTKTANLVIFAVLAIIGLALFFVLSWFSDFQAISSVISQIKPLYFIALVSFAPIVLTIACFRLKTILKGFGYNLKFSELLKVSFQSSLISLIIPSFEISGETYKANKLKDKGVSTPASYATVFFDYLIVFFTNFLGAFVLLVYVLTKGITKISWWLIAIFVLLILVSIFLASRFLKRGWFSKFVSKLIPMEEKTIENLHLFDYGVSFFVKESRKYLILAIILSILGFYWEILQIELALWFLGIPHNFLTTLVFYLGISYFNSVPVFGGIGFGESGAFLAGSALGIEQAYSLSLMLVLRIKQIVILIIGGLIFLKEFLIKRKKTNPS